MTEINESTQAVQERAEISPVTIKMSKLVEGVSLVFAGVLSMLEALDASSKQSLLDAATMKENTAETSAVDTSAEAAEETEAPELAGKDDTQAAEPPSAAEPETATPSVTQDDITKIIVRKIKQNRENSKKIEQILQTYGVSKVSELPAVKYEAFVTDLSAI